jgi:hypothetical protein
MLPKASSGEALGPVPDPNAPSKDWNSNRQTAASAAGMLHRLRRMFKKPASSRSNGKHLARDHRSENPRIIAAATRRD